MTYQAQYLHVVKDPFKTNKNCKDYKNTIFNSNSFLITKKIVSVELFVPNLEYRNRWCDVLTTRLDVISNMFKKKCNIYWFGYICFQILGGSMDQWMCNRCHGGLCARRPIMWPPAGMHLNVLEQKFTRPNKGWIAALMRSISPVSNLHSGHNADWLLIRGVKKWPAAPALAAPCEHSHTEVEQNTLSGIRDYLQVRKPVQRP